MGCGWNWGEGGSDQCGTLVRARAEGSSAHLTRRLLKYTLQWHLPPSVARLLSSALYATISIMHQPARPLRGGTPSRGTSGPLCLWSASAVRIGSSSQLSPPPPRAGHRLLGHRHFFCRKSPTLVAQDSPHPALSRIWQFSLYIQSGFFGQPTLIQCDFLTRTCSAVLLVRLAPPPHG